MDVDVQDKLIDMLATKFEVAEDVARSGQSFEEIGVDSLVLLELALLIRREMGVSLIEEELAPDLTVADLAALIELRRAAA